MMAAPEQRSIFDFATDLKFTAGLREVSNVPNPQDLLQPSTASAGQEVVQDERKQTAALVGEVSDKMLCSACQCVFQGREEQMEHYKLDWHRFNLRQRLAGRAPLTVEEFEKKTGAGDVSSISGSDSDDESDCADEPTIVGSGLGRVSSQVVLQNSQGRFVLLYRCVLQGRRADVDVSLLDLLLQLSCDTVWVILMTGGGHFAGAVFRGKEIVHHKTFHRYTVRAKRGTAQGIRDGQNRSHTPKSAGAALRRYNETALVKDIQEILKNWAEHLKEASAIFLRTPKYNRGVFFGGRGAPLEKNDARIRSLPFATRRATLSEVNRVHETLATVHIYDTSTAISDILSPPKKVWQKKCPNPDSNPSTTVTSPLEEVEKDSSSADEGSNQLEMVEVTFDLMDLREHECKPGKKKRRKRKERKTEKREDSDSREPEKEADVADVDDMEPVGTRERSENKTDKRKRASRKHDSVKDEECEQWEFSLRDALYTACKTGDVPMLHTLLQSSETAGAPNPQGEVPNPLRLLNAAVDPAGFTLLHVASAAGQREAVRELLDAGSDPACRDKRGQTPYAVAAEKDTRNTFRKFMAENPNKYDYAKAQVPGPLTAEIESKKAEKKKAQKAAKKQREREQKEERHKLEQEEAERRRFLALSDREKRALAAERRLAQQAAGTGAPLTNIRRCWQCGGSLLGKVPFECLGLQFCSTRCVQAHRSAAAVSQQGETRQQAGRRK